MKDIHSTSSVATLLPAALYAADNTPAAVDLLGFNSAEILLAIGAGGITFSSSNKIEFVLTHSDDNSNYVAVTDADLIGVSGTSAGIINSLVAAHAAGASYRIGYKGNKRYLKLLADFSGTHGTGTVLAGIVMLGDPAIAPTANQA